MSKKAAITIIASTDTYQNLSSFKNIDDLNSTVRHYKENFADELNKNVVRVLDALHRYSALYKGVSFRTKNNLAIELKISRRTVIRACQKLESLGIIKQYDMKRQSDMKQTSNAIVIQPIHQNVTQETAEIDQKCHTKKTNSTSLKQIINNNVKESSVTFDHTFVSSSIPKEFIEAVSPFYNAPESIYKLWHRLTLAISKTGSDTTLDHNLNEYIKVFKESIYKLKQGKIRKSIFGYLYSAWHVTAKHLTMKSNATTGLYYDWLSE